MSMRNGGGGGGSSSSVDALTEHLGLFCTGFMWLASVVMLHKRKTNPRKIG